MQAAKKDATVVVGAGPQRAVVGVRMTTAVTFTVKW